MATSVLAHVTSLITVLASLATVVGVIVAVQIYRRQMNAQVFLAYTQRYEDIMSSFPHEARAARLNINEALPPASAELSLCVLRYLNLCSEEYYLYRSGHLNRRLWAIWEDELKRTLRSPLFRREWVHLRPEFESYPEFLRFVEEAQMGLMPMPALGGDLVPVWAPETPVTASGRQESRARG